MKSNLLLLLLASVFSLLLGEGLLRLFIPTEGFNHHQLYCEYDPLLGWRKQANISGHHKTSEYEVLEHLNSRGIRGPEYPVEKKPDEFRILVLGDSYAEGYTVAFDSLFSEILEDSLQQKCQDQVIEIINTGTGGWSTDQELLYFEKEGKSFQPDFTILMFCVNDPWYNNQNRYWRGFKPRFAISGDSLTLTNTPVPKPGSAPFFQKAKDWLLLHSKLVQQLKIAKDKLKYQKSGSLLPDEWMVFSTAPPPAMDKAWELTAALLGRLKNSTEKAGSRLMVFYIPEKIEVYEGSWREFLKTYSLNEKAVDKSAPREKLRSICDSLQIVLEDPTDAFRQFANQHPNQKLYFQKDWHWNVTGNRLVGELLSRYFQCSDLKSEPAGGE